MKISCKLHSAAGVAVCAAAMVAVSSIASAAIIYNPIVTMVGDTTASVSGQGRTTTLRVYANSIAAQALPVSELAFNSGATGTRLVNSISATSEGALTNNPAVSDAAAAGTSYSGTVYTYSAGYDAANQTAAITGTATNANRVIGVMNATNNSLSSSAIPFSQTQANAYDNNNFRGATGDDAAANVWSSGTGTNNPGWRYFNTSTQVTNTNSTNTRTIELRNNQLFGSTGAGTTPGRGIYFIGSPPPTTTGNVATQLLATGAASSPYEFVLIDDPSNNASTAQTFGYDTVYVADDSATAANGGIQKWVWNGAAWNNIYTLTDGGAIGNRGLAGQLDADTGKVTLWATTADGTKLEQVTDLGAGAASPFTTLATAPANDVFRGVALTTAVPEPTTLGAIGLLALAALRRRRRAN